MNSLRNCKFCKQEFTISHTPKESPNAFRRVFCKTKCKNAYNRQKVDGKITKQCTLCKKVFLTYPSGATRTYCSYQCKNNSQKVRVAKTCIHCKKEFTATPTRINEFYCSIECFHLGKVEARTCITCSTSFTTTKSSPNVRCSRKCQFTDQSNGKIKIPTNGRTGARVDLPKNLYFKSALEADFARVMNFLRIEFEYEKKTFNVANKFYTPDFYLPEFNTFIELKGVELIDKPYNNMMTRNLNSHQYILNQGIQILTVTQKEFISILKEQGLWDVVPNLEQRNYKKTINLVEKK